MARSRKTLGILAGVTVLVLAIVGFGAWWFFIRDDAPESANLADAQETLDRQSSGSDDSASGVDGTWNVDTTVGSFSDFSSTWAGYRVKEQLASIGANTAVGRTPNVSGSMTIDGDAVTAVDVDVDLTTLRSDSGQRDAAIHGRGLQSDQFPTATFSLTEPVQLPDQIGDSVDATATGELTIHGVTKPVTVDVQADVSGHTAAVVGQAPIVLSDYGIDAPTGFSVLSIDDQGTFEFQIFFSKS
jgi:polyisoprenoid-binding protein YceI